MLEMVSFPFGFDAHDMFPSRPNTRVDPGLLPNGNNLDNVANLPHSWNHHPPASSNYINPEVDLPAGDEAVAPTKHASLFPGQYPYRRQYPSPDQESRPGRTREIPPVPPSLQPQGPRHIILRPVSSKSMSAQSAWLTQLHGINSELWELASSIPCLSHSEDGSDVFTYSGPDAEQYSSQGFPLDSLFKLSRRFLQHLEETKLGDDADSYSESLTPQTRGPRTTSDAGTGLLILSTYVRLLDLYQKVFRNVQAEISHSGSVDVFRLCKLPEVSVGSFPVPPSPTLQMELTLRLAGEFLSQLRAATLPLGSGPPSPDSTPDTGTGHLSTFSGVVGVSLREVISKEKQIGVELDRTRGKLAEMSSTT